MSVKSRQLDEEQAMKLQQFNSADHAAATDLVLACANVRRWAEAVAAARPFGSVHDAVEAARTSADPWSDEEINAALANHPRIGERAAGERLDAQMSRSEQAGVDPQDAGVQERLREGNRAYEERFGYVFLIRAAGRSAEEILAALDERLNNDPSTERQIAAQQLREIACLRLEGVLT